MKMYKIKADNMFKVRKNELDNIAGYEHYKIDYVAPTFAYGKARNGRKMTLFMLER